MKRIHDWSCSQRRFMKRPVGDESCSAYFAEYCQLAGVSRPIDEPLAPKVARKTFVQLTYADIKLNSRSIRSVTGHRTDNCLEKDYADMTKVVSANLSALATIQLNAYRQGYLESPPDSLVQCHQESINHQKQTSQKLEKIQNQITTMQNHQWVFVLIGDTGHRFSSLQIYSTRAPDTTVSP